MVSVMAHHILHSCYRAMSTTYVIENLYHSGVPIIWLPDPPKKFKKLETISCVQSDICRGGDRPIKFNHFFDVAERGMPNVP